MISDELKLSLWSDNWVRTQKRVSTAVVTKLARVECRVIQQSETQKPTAQNAMGFGRK